MTPTVTPNEAAFHGRGHIEKPVVPGYFRHSQTKTDGDIFQPENSKTATIISRQCAKTYANPGDYCWMLVDLHPRFMEQAKSC
jgi:hypothetical protein